MTSLLSQVKRGKIRLPFLGIVYGPDGLGKSTIGSEMPEPMFLGTEKGTANLDVYRYPKKLGTFQDVLDAIEDLRKNEHAFHSLVIDSLDWLEPLVWEHVVHTAHPTSNVKSIEDYGYGKGYAYALDEWRKLVAALGRLREERSMHILLIAHSQVKTAKDPTVTGDYDRNMLKLNDKAAALFREFVDGVYFLNTETLLATDKKGKTRAFGEGDRFLFTERRPAWDAKNRFGLPEKIELVKGESWSRLKAAIDASNPEDAGVVLMQIQDCLDRAQNPKLNEAAKAAIEKSKMDVSELERILSKVRVAAQGAA
jgi:hypothetical protein